MEMKKRWKPGGRPRHPARASERRSNAPAASKAPCRLVRIADGSGGSDAAATLGISPFRTARDLFYDKLNVVTADDAGNWVALEIGHLLEPLVARIFEHKTGRKVYQRHCMFQHPLFPWMLAGLDYLVELPDGGTAILECKTTNYNARNHWWYRGEEIVPAYYEAQGRHYMSVMNIDRVYFCCLFGNNEDEAIIRRMDRLREEHPDIFEEYATATASRRFNIKKAVRQAA